MLDCGIHMGLRDARRIPDFAAIAPKEAINTAIDCVLISHFHLDHCGALPYFTEVYGYHGPVYATFPTHNILPLILEDARRLADMCTVNGAGLTAKDVKKCIERITPINIGQLVRISPGLSFVPYYSGHVLGAVMYQVTIGERTVLFTGDFNTETERHLNPASMGCLRPDLLITESTYGGVLKESRRAKEETFLSLIRKHLEMGGSVLIPLFTFGRTQELCLLVKEYWEQNGLSYPVYSAGEMVEKANAVYCKYIGYTSSEMVENLGERNPFDFHYIRRYHEDAEKEGPCVIFASPGMLHSGLSLKLFKRMCSEPKNLLILSGFCMAGTVGEQVLRGDKRVTVGGAVYDVNMRVENIAFGVHADMNGILRVVGECRPLNVMLVHGEKRRMKKLSSEIIRLFNVPVVMPPNGATVTFPDRASIDLRIRKAELDGLIDPLKAWQRVDLRITLGETGTQVDGSTCYQKAERKEDEA